MSVLSLLRRVGFGSFSAMPELQSLRQRMFDGSDRYGSKEKCGSFVVTINDGPNFYSCYKDIIINQIYSFSSTSANEAPRIIDCGVNIGVSVLYYKHRYPSARIIGFESDPKILPLLKQTLSDNALKDVEIVEAALADIAGEMKFFTDGKYGSTLYATSPDHEGYSWPAVTVRTVPLIEYLDEPVDFLKMNIEGAEWPVLRAAEPRVRQIREMVIEYHHLPGLPRTLHEILALLHRNGFEYLINHFDAQTNPGAMPPFSLGPDSHYFLLIYARQVS